MSSIVKIITTRESFIEFEDENSAREWADRLENRVESGIAVNEVEKDCKVSWGNETFSELEILKTAPIRHTYFGERKGDVEDIITAHSVQAEQGMALWQCLDDSYNGDVSEPPEDYSDVMEVVADWLHTTHPAHAPAANTLRAEAEATREGKRG